MSGAASANGDGTSLAALSRRIAAELSSAAQVCQRAEDLAAGLAADGDAPLARLAPLQALDELTQRLDNLAAVLEAIAEQAPDDWRLNVGPLLAQVRLGELACRLAGAPGVNTMCGEADIF